MSYLEAAACERIARHIKDDLFRLKGIALSDETPYIKKQHSELFVKNIQLNLRHLYTTEAIDFVRRDLGENNWHAMLYYIDKYGEKFNEAETEEELVK